MPIEINQYYLFVGHKHVELYHLNKCLWQQIYNTPLWEADTVLPLTFLPQQARITVLLSNRFCRYLVIPWSPVLKKKQEINHYALTSFATTVGVTPDPNNIQVAVQGYQKPFIASYVQEGVISQLSLFIKKLLPYAIIVSYEPIATVLSTVLSLKNGLFVFAEENTIYSLYYKNSTLLDIESYTDIELTNDTINSCITRQKLRLGEQNVHIHYCTYSQSNITPSISKQGRTYTINEILNKKRRVLWDKINIFHLMQINHHPIPPLLFNKYSAFLCYLLLFILIFSPIAYITNEKSIINIEQEKLNKKLMVITEGLENDEEQYIKQQQIKKLETLLQARKISWDTIYAELEILNYENIRILSIDANIQNKMIEISAEARSLKSVNNYIKDLEKSVYFKDPLLVRHLKQVNSTPQVILFSIRSEINLSH